MLCELKIDNLALIDSLHLAFSGREGSDGPSLAVLTGETGAGKSIILQALNLLAGCKAPNTWIRSGADGAAVEALFVLEPSSGAVRQALLDKGFAVEDDLILKRTFSRQGRSRYFINNSMATAALVGYVCENLFSVASQHEHQVLLASRNHLNFIDSVGELWPQRQEFGQLFARWAALKEEYEKLRQQEQEREQRRDFLAYQLREIQESKVAAGEDEELLAEKNILRSADTLLELSRMSSDILSDTVVANLAQVRRNLEQMAKYDQAAAEMAERAGSSGYELEDLAGQLNRYLDAVPGDPHRLEEIEARIDLLQKLKRKYGGVQRELAEVIRHGEQAEAELAAMDTLEQELAETGDRLNGMESELLQRAERLSVARKKTAADFEKAVSRELQHLSFAATLFKVDFSPFARKIEELTPTGWDRVEFLFSANPGEPLKPLVKTASGGELSRLLLGLKCILARRDQVGTVIFDEVDAGIGGQAAEDIARKIKELSGHHQVFCITHLPQIAAKADAHFMVEKKMQNNRTRTVISLLDEEGRIRELARMLAGNAVTKETIALVKGLYNEGATTETKT